MNCAMIYLLYHSNMLWEIFIACEEDAGIKIIKNGSYTVTIFYST